MTELSGSRRSGRNASAGWSRRVSSSFPSGGSAPSAVGKRGANWEILIGKVVQPWRRYWEQLGYWESPVSAVVANGHRKVLETDAESAKAMKR